MKTRQFLLALTILVITGCAVGFYYVRTTGASWDDTWRVKSAQISPSDYESGRGRVYSLDHPALSRYVYRTVLTVLGVHQVDVPDVDYSQTEQWNIDAGRTPPMDVVYLLRYVNIVFYVAACVLLFATAYLVLRNPWLALATALPFALSERVQVGVVAYLGSDVMLAFFFALAIFLWTLFALQGREKTLGAVLCMSIVCGLTVSTKLNGALLPIAYLAYLAIIFRGAGRIAKPLAAGLVTMAIFFALNPVMRGGGPEWIAGVVREMLRNAKTSLGRPVRRSPSFAARSHREVFSLCRVRAGSSRGVSDISQGALDAAGFHVGRGPHRRHAFLREPDLSQVLHAY